MNRLIVGADKSPLLERLPERFLFIDDGPLIDRLTLPKRRSVTVFDPDQHAFNPLKDMTYRKARDFMAVLDAVFPEGSETLTRRYSNFVLLKALQACPEKLDRLIPEPSKKDTAALDAYQKIQTLLLSPVLERVLNRPTNMSFKGTIIARLDRAALGDFDCFVLGNLLISLFDGVVVVPDFGFYAHRGHSNLIRQEQLVAGIRSFEELPAFRHILLAIENKVASRCTMDDAQVFASYQCKALPNTDTYKDFIDACIRGSD